MKQPREERIYRKRWIETFKGRNAASWPPPPPRTLKRIVAPVTMKATEIWSNVVVVESPEGKGRISKCLVPVSVEVGDKITISVRQIEKPKRKRKQ